MKNQTILVAMLASALSCQTMAGNTYVGGSVSVQRVSAATSKYTGWRPGLFIGYGDIFDRNYYLAGEFLASMASTFSNSYVNRDQNLRITPDFSLSFLPGMILSPEAIGYLRLGLGIGRLHAANEWLSGIVVGAGVEFPFSPCWSVRTEYDYTVFRAIGIGTPQSNELMLSFKYTYDA